MDNFASAEVQKALAEEMSKAFDSNDLSLRSALAKKITQKLQNDIEQRDLSGFLLDKEFIPLGTNVEWTLPSKMRVYWHEPGSYAPRTAIFQKVFTLATEMLSAHPEYELNQLRAGRYGTIADQTGMAREALLGAINAKTWSTVVGSITSAGPNYANDTGGLLTKASLDFAINWANDQAGGGAKAIVGRRHLLNPILDFGSVGNVDSGVFSDSVKDQILRTGAIGVYRGVPLIPLMQWVDGNGSNTITNQDVMVMGSGSGKFVVQQNLDSLDNIDIDALIWHIHMWTRVGMAVWFPERNFRIYVD
jgi:hypothetical protein